MAEPLTRDAPAPRRCLDWLPFVLPGMLLSTWLLLTGTGHLPEYVLPSPGRAVLTAVDFVWGRWQLNAYSGTFLGHAAASLQRVALGFALAAVVGVPCGLLTGCSQWTRRLLDPTVHAVRAVPGIGWLPIAMVWFGVGTRTTVFLIALAAFFPIYVNAALGARSVRPLWVRAAKMLGASRRDLFFTVTLPAGLTATADGLRLGLGVSWAYLVLGELTGVPDGLGAVMMDARMNGQVEIILVTMLAIAVVGRLSDLLLLALFRRVLPPQPR
jgi:sulfonate transport system permease protein